MARIQEGALSARQTPVNPPAPTRLVPLMPQESPPPPPPRIPGLGRPETTRKEAWWERAITWLLSRGEG